MFFTQLKGFMNFYGTTYVCVYELLFVFCICITTGCMYEGMLRSGFCQTHCISVCVCVCLVFFFFILQFNFTCGFNSIKHFKINNKQQQKQMTQTLNRNRLKAWINLALFCCCFSNKIKPKLLILFFKCILPNGHNIVAGK